MTSALSSGVRIRFGIFGCVVVRNTRSAVALMPGVGDIAESRCDNDPPRYALFGLRNMAGVARFAGEGVPGGDIGILRMSAEGGYGQNRGERHPACYVRHDLTPNCLFRASAAYGPTIPVCR